MDDRTDSDRFHDLRCDPSQPGSQPKKAGRRFTDFLRQLPTGTMDGLSYLAQPNELPDVVRVTDDDFYVFSEAFYRQGEPLTSNLERLVLQGMKQEALDKALLLRLCNNAMKWENLERFYYIPVLIALLKVAIRNN